jgi:hypothetical protein
MFSVAHGETAPAPELVKCILSGWITWMTEAARLSQAIRRRPPTLAPALQHLLQTLCGPPLRSSGPLPRAITPCYFELPVTRRLSSAVRVLSPARTRRFDSCQVQLGTRSAIFAAKQHFVQGAPFAIPTAPGADLSDPLSCVRACMESFGCTKPIGPASTGSASGIRLRTTAIPYFAPAC